MAQACMYQAHHPEDLHGDKQLECASYKPFHRALLSALGYSKACIRSGKDQEKRDLAVLRV